MWPRRFSSSRLVTVAIAFGVLLITLNAQANQTTITSVTGGPSEVQLEWQPDPSATSFILYAGLSMGGSDLGFQVLPAGTSAATIAIPPGAQQVHLTLITITPGGNQIVFETFVPAAGPITEVRIVSPSDGALLNDRILNLQWDWPTNEPNSGFFIYVGKSPGAPNAYSAWQPPTARSMPVDIDLDGQPLYVTITTHTGASDSDEGTQTYSSSATYQVASSGSDSGTQITAPSSSTILNSYTQRFEWMADTLAVSLDVETRRFNGALIERQTSIDPSLGFVDLETVLHGDPITVRITSYWAGGAHYVRSFTFQTVLGDEDNDGVGDKLDQCSNTPVSPFVNDNGCIDTRITSPLNNAVLSTYTTRFDWEPDPMAVSLDFEMIGSTGNLIDSQNAVSPAVGFVELQTELHGQPVTLQVKTHWANGSNYVSTYNYQTVLGDEDNDGVDDTQDQCPNTPASLSVDANGCGDSDGDGIPDLDDPYPHQNATQCTP